MNTYYVSNQALPNGYHEVHTEDCRYLAKTAGKKHLGNYSTCFPAVVAAKSFYPQSNGCKFCCNPCHLIAPHYETDTAESINLLLKH